jgi:hypothetical protein
MVSKTRLCFQSLYGKGIDDISNLSLWVMTNVWECGDPFIIDGKIKQGRKPPPSKSD